MNYTSKITSKVPWKQRWKHSDEDLIASAAPFKHRKEWKNIHPEKYNAAWRRGLLDKCCAHMTPAANPYAGDYVIYAYEFADKHVYVGLTFLPAMRRSMHKLRGPVAHYALICANYTHKQLETGLQTPEAAAEAESKWLEQYRAAGWTLLNQNKAGGLGALQKTKWTREAVLAEALKYQTRQAWIDGSQMSYRIAKREGWFAEASAHMPKRKLGVGAGRKVSAATRCKQRKAKLGGTLTKAHCDKISESVRTAWAVRSKRVKENSSLC